MLDGYEDIFDRSELSFDRYYLHNNQYILNQYENYDDNKVYNELIDLFCIQLIREVAIKVYEESEFNLESVIDIFFEIMKEMEIDFYNYILLYGKDYLNSNEYDYGFTDNCYKRDRELMIYIILLRYDKVVQILKSHYKTNSDFIAIIFDEKLESTITDFSDIYDNLEVMRLYQWFDNGCCLSGE